MQYVLFLAGVVVIFAGTQIEDPYTYKSNFNDTFGRLEIPPEELLEKTKNEVDNRYGALENDLAKVRRTIVYLAGTVLIAASFITDQLVLLRRNGRQKNRNKNE